MTNIKMVRYAGPKAPSVAQGALAGLANSINIRNQKKKESEDRAYDKTVAEQGYNANFLTAMANQGRTPLSGGPDWMSDMKFNAKPQTGADAKAAYELSQLQDPAAQKQALQLETLKAIAGDFDKSSLLPYINQMSGANGGNVFEEPYSLTNRPYPQASNGNKLGRREAMFYMQQARGIQEKAMEMAAKDGFTWDDE